jgi:IMP dehydrogenase
MSDFWTGAIGHSAESLFTTSIFGYTYDDLILMPDHINFPVHAVDLSTRLTRNIRLNIPIVSSPMDTVSESRMCIALAQMGGIGFLHCNNTIEQQIWKVGNVKNWKNGFITRPFTISPETTLEQIDEIIKLYDCNGFPVTDTGKVGGKLVGLVCERDMDFIEDRKIQAKDIMTPASDLIVGDSKVSLEEAHEALRQSKKSILPIVGEDFSLLSLISRSDLKRAGMYPNCTLDTENRLRVGAAITTKEQDKDRLAALVKAEIDVIVIDSRQGDSDYQAELLHKIKREYPGLDVVAGNVVTVRQARRLIEAGADALRVGMGAASISAVQEVCAVGRAQATALYHVSRFAKEKDVPVIADGGISNSGMLVKALCVGSSSVMLGSLLAGTEESPGEYYFHNGKRVKKYKAKRSPENTEKKVERDENIVPLGVSGTVVDRGSVRKLVPYLIQSVKHGFQDAGLASISQAHEYLYNHRLRFEIRSNAAQKEGAVHGLLSYESRF